MSTIKKNIAYNTIYQILILIIPLITLPYVSRVLNADGVGIYSFTYSIVNYFMLFSLLGINKYGNRLIAKVRDDKEKLSKEFWSLYFFQLITTFISATIYMVYLLTINNSYKSIAYIQMIYLISTALDINWFFFGMEKFKITVTRNTVIKVIALFLIFAFVKTSNDIWIYTLILSGSAVVSNLILFPFLRKYITKVHINFSDIIKHFKPNLIMFIPVLSVSIYTIMDKIMLGAFTNVSEVGYYENAEKIIQAPMAILTAVGTVMMPRISNLVSNNSEDIIKKLLTQMLKFIMFVSLPMALGLMAISKDFSIILFGQSFEKTGLLISILSINIIIFAWGNVFRTQYLIPKEKDKEYVLSGLIGAFINVILNLLLIPRLLSVGACISTVVCELGVTGYQSYILRKELNLKEYLNSIIGFIIKALIMLIIILLVHKLAINSTMKMLIQIFIGVIVYSLINIKYIKTLFFNKN